MRHHEENSRAVCDGSDGTDGFCGIELCAGKGPAAEPPAKAECKVADGKTITIDYSSPRMKGRKIFGELVPYGKVWRAGANEATAARDDGRHERWRHDGASRRLYNLRDSDRGQVDAGDQQEDRRVGHGISGRSETTWRALIWPYQRRLRQWRISRLTSIKSAADARCK